MLHASPRCYNDDTAMYRLVLDVTAVLDVSPRCYQKGMELRTPAKKRFGHLWPSENDSFGRKLYDPLQYVPQKRG